MIGVTMRTLLIETRTHGRVLVRDAAAPRGVLAGFHGYMESAETMMARLEAAAPADWTLIAIQGLHRFYRGRSEDVVAGWMTRQDREAAIADNIEYANRALAVVRTANVPVVFAGFSQGVAMAFRAAVRGVQAADAVVAAGGDVPPELLADATAKFPRVLLARGSADEWYTDAKLEADVAALRARGVSVTPLVYDGPHEWTPELAIHVSRFLR